MSDQAVQWDNELIGIFNALDHGPSPWGMTTHSMWAECGKKGRLHEEKLLASPYGTRTAFRPEYKSSMTVGLDLHKLFEARYTSKLGKDLIWDARLDTFDVHFREALRVYTAYHSTWGSIEEKWGCEILEVETEVGTAPGVEDRVVHLLGGPLTGRKDLVINIVDPEHALRNTGIHLLPGRYIFDHKYSTENKKTDVIKFGPENLQAKTYLWLEAVELGEHGAQGTIFERFFGHVKLLKDKSYASYVVYPGENDQEILRAVVQLSMAHREKPLPNPHACRDQWGRECYLKTLGVCPGF